MSPDTLIERIGRAVRVADFTDVYRNRVDASAVRQLYEAKRRYPLSSTDAIRVPPPELDALVSHLDVSLGDYKSPVSGLIGNGLYLLKGSSASPRLPSAEDYAKILVLAAARIGAERVAELFAAWLHGRGIRADSCALLKGLQTKGKLTPAEGMHLETLSNNGDDLPRSLQLDPHEHMHEQFTSRAMLSFEYELMSPLPLYQPKVERETFPPSLANSRLANPDLSSVSFESLCRAISLETNNHVDWFIQWEDCGDVEAFFLNAGFSSRRKEASSSSIVSVSEEDLRRCLDTHALLHGFRALDLPIARWRRSKHAPSTNEQLIELRIALESVLLGDDKGAIGEKRHRLAIRGAWFLGKTFDERKRFFDVLRDVYDYASSVIHGGTPKVKGKHDLGRTIAEGQDLCRNAVLRVALAKKMPNWSDVILGREEDQA